jgi:predicted alpha/beta hydrolase family esterase
VSPVQETVVLVPGLRGHVEDHWQTHLARMLPNAVMVPPLGREDASLDRRVARLDRLIREIDGPVVLVAHSAGALVAAHWAAAHLTTGYSGPVVGALLATPPALADELPAEYPSIRTLRAYGWLPVPRIPLPFPSIVATSTDDPLGNPVRVRAMARAWGSRLRPLGAVGHLNPASGYGEWPDAVALIAELADDAQNVGRPGDSPRMLLPATA